jgi:hypothetical protein
MSAPRSSLERAALMRSTVSGRLRLSERKARMLLKAMLVEIPSMGVLGYLVDARINCECAQGFIYKGWKNGNGEFISSGQIVEILQYKGHWLLNTIDMDWFVVVNFHTHGGRRSLVFLVELLQSAALVGSEYCWH